MNHFDRLSHTAGSAEILRTDAAPVSPDWDAAIGHLDDVTRDLRAMTASLTGREAAISAGHRALARMMTTRDVPVAPVA